MNNIRNFCIIAHIDHGKSTLADRILEITGAISKREMREQVLDKMDLERERGITIKAKAVRLDYTLPETGQQYILNLIDTPGHVDFTYEVSKSLAACEGAILVIDASQGVEAQTVANIHLALNHNLTIIPVINKIDLQQANPDGVKLQIEEILAIPAEEAILASAKEGIGIAEILSTIVKKIPPPISSVDLPLKALVFDSAFDIYRGVIIFVRIFDGCIKAKDKILMMKTHTIYEVEEIGVFRPNMAPAKKLCSGEVGYIVAGIKEVSSVKIGDTITNAEFPTTEAFPGYKEVMPMVFCGLFPINPNEYALLKDALDKLKLNDASFNFEPERSTALGFGYRCGFLGLLHMDIIQERLEREYNLNLIATSPNVRYVLKEIDGNVSDIENPSELPPIGQIEAIEEPYIKATLILPPEYIGPVMTLCQDKRGIYKNTEYPTIARAILIYELPLAEVMFDFYDKLKSISKGYASFDYELIGFRQGDLVKLDILVASEIVDALSFIVHRDKAYSIGKQLAEKLKTIIPRQLFEVPLQASIGNKVIARETIPPMRKDVIAKCYGGDITRKRKLLEKQKEGKKRMKRIGKIEIPQEAFLAVLKVE